MNKKNLIWIIPLCFLLMGASHKLSLFNFLNNYEEDCYNYKIEYWNETYCEGHSQGDFYIAEYKTTNNEYPCCSNFTFNFTSANSTVEEHRWCNSVPFNKTFLKFTDECDEYHLVRKVSKNE